MIKRNLLKIGCVVALTGLILTGCKTKDTGSTNETATTVIEEVSTSEKESESVTEVETTTEVETEKIAEIEVTQPVTEAPKPVETQPVTEAPKPAVTEAPKPVKTQPVTEAPKGSFDNPIQDDTDYTWSAEKESIMAELDAEIAKNPNKNGSSWTAEDEAHLKDDYNWAVKKVAEWKAINPDPAYLIGMFGCYAQSHWYYNTTMDDGAFKHAISYYGNGVCTDIETCFHTFCDVAGIPCERIEDWTNYKDGHTWDKVTIDGVQYEVDMTRAISVPKLGQFESLVADFNTSYYGNDEFPADRLYGLESKSYY